MDSKQFPQKCFFLSACVQHGISHRIDIGNAINSCAESSKEEKLIIKSLKLAIMRSLGYTFATQSHTITKYDSNLAKIEN